MRRISGGIVVQATPRAEYDHALALGDEGERFVRAIADAMPGMIAYWDRDLRCRFANRAYFEWFGRMPDEMVGITIQSLLGDSLFARNEVYIRGALAGERQLFERTLVKADGSIGHTLANYIPDFDGNGAVAGFFVLVTDVTPLKAARKDLELAASIIQNAAEAIFVTDADARIESVNPAFTAMTGFTAEYAVGRSASILTADDEEADTSRVMLRALKEQGRWQGEVWYRRKDGSAFRASNTISAIGGGADAPVRYATLFTDVTERWQQNERARYLAFHDALTDLPNRSLLMERLEAALGRAGGDRSIALLFIDLDEFKQVNDRLGHDVGDSLLEAVATRLKGLVRHSDTVARLGGDEFVVLLEDAGSDAEISAVARRILTTVREPVSAGDIVAQVGSSIGIALWRPGTRPAELLAEADEAMYVAKQAGGNQVTFFERLDAA